MSESIVLLDTPKRASLQSQATGLRVALKEFERIFATKHEGRKPSREDIKADIDVAAKYKQYNRIRDALSGAIDYETFVAAPRSPTRRNKHERVDTAVAWTPRKSRNQHATPRKSARSSEGDDYDVPSSATRRPVFLTTLGPTPHRDGQILGLFDMLSNSAKSSQATPSSRKRKLDEAAECSPVKTMSLPAAAQTPSRTQTRKSGDLLKHLTGTPETGNGRHSRTPASDGRKFMLNQFFATPSATRYSFLTEDVKEHEHRTPLRDHVLQSSPNETQAVQNTIDATPAYLKRSISFKDRLLSASDHGVHRNIDSSTLFGPRTEQSRLQRFMSAPKPLSEIVASLRKFEDGEHDDDLEALREMEDTETNTRVGSGQDVGSDHSDHDDVNIQSSWKKRGQKRTTKRAKMRPTFVKIPRAPKFIAPEGTDDQHDVPDARGGSSRPSRRPAGDVTNIVTQTSNNVDKETDAAYQSDFSDTQTDSDNEREEAIETKKTRRKTTTTNDNKANGIQGGPDAGPKGANKKIVGRINPNAQSHMNFRTLKIRNRNSKAGRAAAVGGRRRTGKR